MIKKNINDFSTAVEALQESAKKGNLEAIRETFGIVNTKYNELVIESECLKEMESASFATLNHILNESMPSLLMKKKSSVGKIISEIKKDKNLLTQARFFNAMSEYDGSSDAKSYISECVSMVGEKLNPDSVLKSNKHFANVLFNNGLRIDENVSEGLDKFGKDCQYLLSTEKKFNNVNEIAARTTSASEYIAEHKSVKGANNVYEECDALQKSMSQLNEDERNLVNDIIEAKSEAAELKQRKLFNKYRNECINYINNMIAEGNDVDKLQALKERILAKEFDKDHIVEDIAKFLEIGSVLAD